MVTSLEEAEFETLIEFSGMLEAMMENMLEKMANWKLAFDGNRKKASIHALYTMYS